LAQMVGDG